MTPLAAGLSYIDLNFLGVPRVIATAVLHGRAVLPWSTLVRRHAAGTA